MGHLRQQKHDEELVEWRNIPPIQPGQCFQAIQPWGDVLLLLLERAGGRPAFVLNINATSHFVQHTFDCSGLLHFVYLSFGCFVTEQAHTETVSMMYCTIIVYFYLRLYLLFIILIQILI